MQTNEIDKISLKNAKKLYDTGDIEKIAVGTVKGLQAIHKYLFNNLYDYAGKMRLPCLHFPIISLFTSSESP